ncbi:DDB1- and CUL4-associated factor 11 [Brevipalpus obovatus]|uniref:DDB1- and CUL4-associated factor 11 n=1 Tax=Brevipalpus obovatus TaxID=246614 RepID=UPI003D9E5840
MDSVSENGVLQNSPWPATSSKVPFNSCPSNHCDLQDITFMQSGLIYSSSLPKVLSGREHGSLTTAISRYSPPNLTRSYRSYVASKYLPSQMTKIDQYQQKAFCGFYSRSGNIFLTAAQDFSLRIYDTCCENFKLMRTVFARDVGWSVLDVDLSPDGQYFVYSSWSDYLNLCSVTESEFHQSLPLDSHERMFCIFSLRFSHDGQEIIGGANNGCVYIFNRAKNQRTHRIKCHPDDLNTVALADSSSNIIFSGSDDGFLKVWDRRTLDENNPKPVGIFIGHRQGIIYIDSRGDGRHLISNSKDQSIKLWDMRKFCPVEKLPSKIDILGLDWDYRWQDVPKELLVEPPKMDGDTSLLTFRGHSVRQTLIRCHFSPMATTGQRYIYTGCAAGRVYIYDVMTGSVASVLEGHQGCVRDVSWHPELPDLVSSSWDNTIAKWSYSEETALVMDRSSHSESRLRSRFARHARGLNEELKGT